MVGRPTESIVVARTGLVLRAVPLKDKTPEGRLPVRANIRTASFMCWST